MKKTLPVVIIILAFWIIPDNAAAQVQGLANVCSGPDCSACNLIDLGNRLITWLIGVITVLFAVLMVVAGFGLITSGGNQSALQAAKSKFTNALIGFMIVLAAWLLIDTLMRGLIGNNGNITGWGPWAQVQCWSQTAMASLPETSVEPPGALGGSYSYVDPVTGFITTTPAGDPSVAGSGLTDAQVKVLLDGAGIKYKGNVSGTGVRQHVVDELINLNAACGCNITVTSLTDGNHAGGQFSHGNGFKADLRSVGGGDPNPKLVSYVKSLPPAGQWRDGTKLYYDSASCGTYAVEGDHIDVVYKTGC